MPFKYTVGNLKILSEINIPTLNRSEFSNPDINIFLTEKIESPAPSIEFLNKQEIVYRDMHDNKFLISDSKIFISPNENKIKNASVSIVGIPLGFLLQKRNYQVVHGSCVAMNGKAVCFVGKSASGKSSIALSLLEKKFKFVSEDLCVIRDNEVYNFSSWVKSDQKHLIKKLAITETLVIERDSRNRQYYKLANHYTSCEKVELKAIYFLNNEKERAIKKIDPSDSFKYLFTYAYRSHDSDKEGLGKLTSICGGVDCFSYSRSMGESLNKNTAYFYEHFIDHFKGV